jgi:hypothetical protein
MSEAIVTKSKPTSGRGGAVGRLFVLEASGGRIHSMNLDGSDRKVIVTDCRLPDGIAVDIAGGHIYWANMGVPNLDDGSIERADIDGKNRRVIVARGATFTPKQIHFDKKNGKLYWCDREGMRVMRCNLDGSQNETLVEAGRVPHGSPEARTPQVAETLPSQPASPLEPNKRDHSAQRNHGQSERVAQHQFSSGIYLKFIWTRKRVIAPREYRPRRRRRGRRVAKFRALQVRQGPMEN